MEQSEFTLDVRLVTAGPAATAPGSDDCTDDGCGQTPGSAGITSC